MKRVSNRNRSRAELRFESLELRQLLAADVMISEIMYHPESNNSAHEFIEIYNRGDQTADLTGWKVSNGVEFSFPEVSVPADGYLVVAADVAEFQSIYGMAVTVVGGWNGRLANRGETISIVDENGNEIDRVRYADEGEWSTRILGEPDAGFEGWKWHSPHDGDGRSLELINASLTNDVGQNWSSSVIANGTPGRPNSVASKDMAPIVTNVRHSPAIPNSSQPVTVFVDIADELADATVTLNYRPNAAGFTWLTMSPVEAEETIPGTKTYAATIHAAPDRTVMEFFVAATDGSGQTRMSPNAAAHSTRTANYLYQVLNDAPNSGNWSPNEQPVSYLIMREPERRLLADIGDGPLVEAASNAAMNATFIRVDGNGTDVRYNVSVRNRGGSSRIGPPNNYRVNFPHDQPWDGSGAAEGSVSVNFNSRFVHAQILGSVVFRMAGLPAADATPVQVRVNGEDLASPSGPLMFGSYAQLETITGSFPDQHFPDDRRGNLYRAVAAGTETANLRYLGPDREAYANVYSKRTNEEQNDWSDLIQLTRVLNETPGELFVEKVGEVIDIDQWLRYIALDSLLGNLETGFALGVGDNYWLYRGEVDTRFRLIPHDLDTILGRGRVGEPNRSIFTYTAVPGLSKLLTHPETVPRYYRAFLRLINDVYNAETLHPLMDQVLGGFVPADELEEMKQFVVDRIVGVMAQLPQEFAITSDLPTVNGVHRTTLPAAELVGTADAIRAQRVEVNGKPVDWSPFTREWSVRTSTQGETRGLVDFGASWKYLDDGSNQASTWRQNGLDDSGWESGLAPLGYGNGTEATTVSFGSNPNNKHITTYFRHSFDLSESDQVRDLTLRLKRDDGAIVYLNGVELARSNLPSGQVDFQTVASTWIGGGLEEQIESYAVDPSLLLNGKNVLAVEIHQRSAIDDDIRMDLSLEATVGEIEGGVRLLPGLNRIDVATFEDEEETTPYDRKSVDIWYDGAIGHEAERCEAYLAFGQMAPPIMDGGAIHRDTVMAPCGPAYRVTGEVMVPEGVTLTVLPGTSVFFEEDAGLVVDGGRLVANGEQFEPIRFSRPPGSNGSWRGIQFQNAMTDNHLSHAIIEHAATADGMIGLQSSELTVDSVTFEDTDRYRIRTIDSSLVVRNSTFADIFTGDQPPTTDNRSEHIWGSGIADGGLLLIQNNYFGTTKGHNDAIDFGGAALPGPIPIIENNVFAGSGDDAIDLETDAFIIGNTFANIEKDEFNSSTGDANAISAGAGRNYFVARNVFINVDHAVQVKDDAFLTFQNNTVAGTNISAIYFDLDDRSPGKGALISDSIFHQTPVTLGSPEQAEFVSLNNSIVEDAAGGYGSGNLELDPRFQNHDEGDYRLRRSSPAVGTGTLNIDRGALVDNTLRVHGLAESVISEDSVRLSVYAPGMIEYRYRLNDDEWSDVFPLDEQLNLTDLQIGEQHIEVIGRDYAGRWQTEDAISTATWTVAPTQTGLRINEILASNRAAFEIEGDYPDAIELFNGSNEAIDLSGMSLTDDLSNPSRFVFPTGSFIDAHGYFVVTNRGGELGFDFGLNANGETVSILDATGELVDSVSFGMQATDFSIGRTGRFAEWNLTTPTIGNENERQRTGDVESLRINEWLASSIVRFKDDFIELHNSDSLPVDLSGMFVTDDLVARPNQHAIAPLSFIGPNDFAVFYADGNTSRGPEHLPFRLRATGEAIAIRSAAGDLVDQVLFFEQTDDWSLGRAPDGAAEFTAQKIATPGSPNVVFETVERQLVNWQHEWTFEQSSENVLGDWRLEGFDDSNWSIGSGVFAIGADDLPEEIGTELSGPALTTYFRTKFDVGEFLRTEATMFEMELLIDDGAAIYLNGKEITRLGLPGGDLTPETRANRGVSVATVEAFTVPSSMFQLGENTLAVELHQVSPVSADAVFGLSLQATSTNVDPEFVRSSELLDGLRVTEVMYHPAADAELEFVELANISDRPIDLAGVRIRGGIEFEFDESLSQILQPEEYVVVVHSESKFRQAYGPNVRIVGEFSSRLSNSSDRIQLLLPKPFRGSIVDFTYDDRWHALTDGGGPSLTVRDAVAHPGSLRNKTAWTTSHVTGGSPGHPEPMVSPDLNIDGFVDVQDVDLLCVEIHVPSGDLRFDLNADFSVDHGDLTYLIGTVFGSLVGDVNLDRRFDSRDLVMIFQAGQYNDRQIGNSVWSTGDWNCDGDFDSSDLVLAFQQGGYSSNASAAWDLVAAVLDDDTQRSKRIP